MEKYILLALAVGLEATGSTTGSSGSVFCTTRDRHLTVRSCDCPAPAANDAPMVRIVRVTTTNNVGYRCIRQCAIQDTDPASVGICGCADSRVKVDASTVSTTGKANEKGWRCQIPCTDAKNRLTTLACGCKEGYVKKLGRTKQDEPGFRCEQKKMGEFQDKMKLPFIGEVPVRMLMLGAGALVIILCLLVVMCSYKSKYDEMVLNLDQQVVDTDDLPEPEEGSEMGVMTPRDPRLAGMLSARGTTMGRKSVTQFDRQLTLIQTMPTLDDAGDEEEKFEQFVQNLKNIGFFKNYEPGTSDYEARMDKVKERWEAQNS